ncbi:RICIN domain-containing protein [Streptomyces sp. NPDC012508]|uniref:RICIN domain-containing protein n=1 Tax=Streptomyces sp. NPDC012508 TaxID=3364837 RepID=UPI003679706F
MAMPQSAYAADPEVDPTKVPLQTLSKEPLPDSGVLDGYIMKIKTMWGGNTIEEGGYALNIGYDQGDTANGALARVWNNRHWDNNNRWVFENGDPYGYYMYRNKYTNQCLTATSTLEGAPVVQQPCDFYNKAQRWALNNGNLPRYFYIRNKMLDEQSGRTMVLSQLEAVRGSMVVTQSLSAALNTQPWNVRYCGDTQDCFVPLG